MTDADPLAVAELVVQCLENEGVTHDLQLTNSLGELDEPMA